MISKTQSADLNHIRTMQRVSSVKDFEILSKLGEGSFGVVFKVRRKADGKEYAMKKVKLMAMGTKERENAVNEIRILASLNNDFIIGFKDTFYDDTTSMLCIVMEFASGGDVLKKINSHIKTRTHYAEQQIWKALVHMAKGLKSLHDNRILHRDLKCANVFVTAEGIYKLGDLNVSKVMKKAMAYTQTGTPYYASPEVWNDQPYDMKSDIWSLGCVVYQMAALRPPFRATDMDGLFKKIKTGKFDRIPSNYSSDLAAMIAQMLKLSPHHRLSVDQILSSPVTARHYSEGGLLPTSTEKAELLKTIKCGYDLKALNHKLPRANYLKEIKEESTADVSLDRAHGTRDRVMSAGGIRHPNFCESPNNIRPKKQQPQLPIFSNKNIDLNPVKLPPLPNKLPPRNLNNPQLPIINQAGGIRMPSPKINKSREGDYRQYLASKQPNTDRDKSKENLRNVGANIVNNVLPRSNSVHKIAPDW